MKILIPVHAPEYSSGDVFLCFYQAYFKKYKETLFGGTVAHNIITIHARNMQATCRGNHLRLLFWRKVKRRCAQILFILEIAYNVFVLEL